MYMYIYIYIYMYTYMYTYIYHLNRAVVVLRHFLSLQEGSQYSFLVVSEELLYGSLGHLCCWYVYMYVCMYVCM